jgi:hypothetical protein
MAVVAKAALLPHAATFPVLRKREGSAESSILRKVSWCGKGNGSPPSREIAMKMAVIGRVRSIKAGSSAGRPASLGTSLSRTAAFQPLVAGEKYQL